MALVDMYDFWKGYFEMTTEFKDVLDWLDNNKTEELAVIGNGNLEPFHLWTEYDTIRRALLIADKLMQPVDRNIAITGIKIYNETMGCGCGECDVQIMSTAFEAMRDQLLREVGE